MKPTAVSMRIGALLGVAFALSGCGAILNKHPVGNLAVPEPARSIDLERYSGRWFEIARYEQGFQKDCEGVTADYTIRGHGRLDVLNRCREPDGDISDAKGKAKIVDLKTKAKLKVSFFGPFYGDYWVLDRAEDYSWAIVGDPSGRYLWILSREATPSATEKADLIARAAAMGYDTTYLRMTAQP